MTRNVSDLDSQSHSNRLQVELIQMNRGRSAPPVAAAGVDFQLILTPVP